MYVCMYVCILCMYVCMQARSQGGSGGGGRPPPPQLPIPKILFHPLAILFHPLAILFHPLAILFHPLAILFHPWNMWMTSHGQCPRGGGVLVNVQEGGVFQFFGGRMTSRGQCPRGGVRLVFHLSKFRPPPHLAGWLRAWYVCVYV